MSVTLTPLVRPSTERPTPSAWRRKPLRYLCRMNPTKSEVSRLAGDTEVSFVPMEAVREFGGLDLSQTRPIETVLQGYSYFRNGDVVIAKITPCFENGKGSIATGLLGGVGFGTTELHVLRCGSEIDREFLFYLTLSHDFRHRGAGWMYGAGGQKRVPEEFLRNYVAPLPPLPEQRAIAAWLDDRTKRIDELVAAKRRLIELLAEQRTALITKAVTKGLNPDAPMKPSGIDWLGDVPRHWGVRRLRHLVSSIEQGWSPEADQREAGEDEWGVMRAGCANGGQFNESDNKALPVGVSPDPSLEIRPGDLLMSRACGSTELVGSVALVRSCRPKLLLCDKLFRLRYRSAIVTPEFLYRAMNSRLIRLQLKRDLSGAEGLARNIAQGAIKELVLCLPSIDDQKSIVAHLDTACQKFDALTVAAENAIARLNEYRQSLITAAVTGKIDVRKGANA
jgi:type I restriction enzyme, S subunit